MKRAEKMINFSPPDITDADIEQVASALRSGWITTGPKTKLFERKIAEFCGTNRALAVNSATSAMELVLRMLGIGPGDEVITSAYTYSASCACICHVGATPVLVDTTPGSFEMDYGALLRAITEKTKAVIPVDLAGKMCDYERIFSVLQEKKAIFKPKTDLQKAIGRIVVLADGAHAFGAKLGGKKCGSVADFTCFSFHAVKNLTTAEGGAVTWREIPGVLCDDIYRSLAVLGLHGQTKDALAKTKPGAWEYDIEVLGYKCNMPDTLAVLGLSQLARYEQLLARRREIIERYNKNFANENVTPFSHFGKDFSSSGHLYMLRLDGKNETTRNELIHFMADHEIATNVHYKPLPMFTAYRKMGFNIRNFPNAFTMYENEISLPLHTLLSDEDVDVVSSVLLQFLG